MDLLEKCSTPNFFFGTPCTLPDYWPGSPLVGVDLVRRRMVFLESRFLKFPRPESLSRIRSIR